MREVRTWRELLGIIISDNKERQHLIDALNVTPITLTRWVNGESDPRPQNLHRLVAALPTAHQERIRALLRAEKGQGEFVGVEQDESIKEISSEFYGRVLTARATSNANVRFWSTSHLIIQQAIGQLDPERLGMCIWVVCCMPPSGPHQKVRSLRESVGLGTPPWPADLEQTAMFLGAESLAGNVVTLCRPGLIQDVEEELPMLPAMRADYEKSSAIFPILYAGRIAGVLLVSSAQKNFFLQQARVELVHHYADLIALAFNPEDFYAPEQIALHVMPPQSEQKAYFTGFRQRVVEVMRCAAQRNQLLHAVQADMLVWQQLEEELLSVAALKSVSPNGM